MKKLMFLLLISTRLFATNYYLSDKGSDEAAGTSAEAAWKSIAKLNASFKTIAPGDAILFKRGDTFYGTITILKSGTSAKPITIGAYGTGVNPIITGFTTIAGWTNEGGGIYSKVITSEAQTNMVTIDGVQYGMGRYPDNTYLTFTGFLANNKIWKSGMSNAANWTGAEVVIRKTDYQIDRCKVNSQLVDTINYTSLGSTAIPKSVGFGYFIQNDLRTLTTYGEWYHDYAGTGKFYMYFGTRGPTGHAVNVATVNNLVYANASNDYITCNGIAFEGSISDANYFASGNDGIIINNCSIRFAGRHGVYIGSGGVGFLVSNCAIDRCNNMGVISFATSSTINNNTITNCTMIPGQALTSYYLDIIYSAGNGVTIQENTLKNGGGSGIFLGYNGTATSTVQYNRIDSVMLITDDGAAIYTAGNSKGARIINGNIVSNVIGNSDGTNTTTSISAGIYMDEPAQNVTTTNNTVFDIVAPAGSGIKMHRANTNIVSGNTVYNCGNAIQILNTQATNAVYANIIKHNIFFAKSATQKVMSYSSHYNDMASFGESDSNYWARPIDDNVTFFTNEPGAVNVNRSLATWQSFTKLDTHSRNFQKKIKSLSDLAFKYNASNSPIVFHFSGLRYEDVYGTTYDNSATIPPWSSKILILVGAVP